jgi:7,8-dihydropterin-6-yl-methyl-4-(beta-D-ribofuranosyl)aminobenzene 5'-phosphate synthase
VPRWSFEQAGIPASLYYRKDSDLVRDLIEDDQALAIRVPDKGLVVVSGCAHAGILNTVRHAQEISGVDQLWGILGGFHLARADQDDVQRTIEQVRELGPRLISPSHCTGFGPICAFARQMPDEFVLGVVGTTYLF